MGSPVLEVKQISKKFGSKQVLRQITLQVARGEVFGFLGPNGAGKTTLIRIILGLVRPDGGEIRICGHPVRGAFTRAIARVGAVVETPKFFPNLTGRQNLQLVRNLHPEVPGERIDEVLALTGMAGHAHTKTGAYSLGMKQRLGIARALVNDPELVFLDEPMNGLDPQGIIEMRALIDRLRRRGIAFFITSHLLHEVEQVCDKIAIIKSGRLLLAGKIEELLACDTETVEIYTEQPDKAYLALENVPFVRKRRLEAGKLIVDLELGSSVELNKMLVEGNVPVRYLVPRKNSLEDFFMERTYGEESV
ncbi:MAG TPA: ABC transporter ATP-binding protein [Firmicutes bacterium]|nr:ABC transporter ATP-binding protein [Bacillota bacterium]